MKLFSIQKLLIPVLLILCLICISGSIQFPEIPVKQYVKFAGRTKTLVNLLKTNTPESSIIGAYVISLESMKERDIATLFVCDSVNVLSDINSDDLFFNFIRMQFLSYLM
jgi:hypothetical protein